MPLAGDQKGRKRRLPPYVQVRYDPRDRGKPRDERRIISFRGWGMLDGVRTFGEARQDSAKAHVDAMEIRGRAQLLPAARTSLKVATAKMLADLAISCAPGTIAFYRGQSKAIFRILNEDAPLALVNGEAIAKLIEKAIKGGYSAQTILHYRTFLGRLFAWCSEPHRRLWVGANPVKHATWPEAKRARPDCLTVEEMAARLEQLRVAYPEDYDLVLFMAFTGLRRAEMARLHSTDVDMKAGVFWADGKMREEPAPITIEIRAALQRMLDRADGGFLVRLAKMPTPGKGEDRRWQAIDRVFRRWKELCSDRRIHPHTLRHALATNMIRAGIDVGHVQRMLRHASPETTNRYVHLVAGDLHRSVSQVKYLQGGKAPSDEQHG